MSEYEGKHGGSVPKIPDAPDTRHAEARGGCGLPGHKTCTGAEGTSYCVTCEAANRAHAEASGQPSREVSYVEEILEEAFQNGEFDAEASPAPSTCAHGLRPDQHCVACGPARGIKKSEASPKHAYAHLDASNILKRIVEHDPAEANQPAPDPTVQPWMEQYKNEADAKKIGLVLSGKVRDELIEAHAQSLFEQFHLTTSNLDAPAKLGIRAAISEAIRSTEKMISALASALEEWQPIETAPRDGSHFIAANLTPGHIGFGYFEDKTVPFCDVVHYWPNEGEEGFYPSNGPDEPYTFLTHWKPTGAKF